MQIFKVIDTRTGEDVTNQYNWSIDKYNMLGYSIGKYWVYDSYFKVEFLNDR